MSCLRKMSHHRAMYIDSLIETSLYDSVLLVGVESSPELRIWFLLSLFALLLTPVQVLSCSRFSLRRIFMRAYYNAIIFMYAYDMGF